MPDSETTTPAAEPKAVLLGKIHDVTEFASKDATRYTINSVHYNAKHGCVEATNGRILIRVPVTAKSEDFPLVKDTAPAADVVIPVGPYKKVMSKIPNGNSGALPILKHARLSESKNGEVQYATLTTTDLETEEAIRTKAVEGKYPNCDQVIPEKAPTFSICLSAIQLEHIVEYANKHGISDKPITFEFNDNIDPVRFRIDVKDAMGDIVKATGVLMPMRLA